MLLKILETTIGNGAFNIQRQLSIFYTDILIVNIWGCKNNRCLNWRFWDFEDEFRHDYLFFILLNIILMIDLNKDGERSFESEERSQESL